MKHVFFDLDGTLMDSLPGIAFSLKKALDKVLPGRRLPDAREYIGPPVRDILRGIAQTEDSKVLDELEGAFRKSYDSEGWKKGRLYDGAIEVTGALRRRGYAAHILTNKPHIPTMRILDYFGLFPYIGEVIAPEWEQGQGRRKADAALEAAARLGIAAEEGIVVGDSCDDADAAEACGFVFIAANYGYGEVKRRSGRRIHFEIDHLPDLGSILF